MSNEFHGANPAQEAKKETGRGCNPVVKFFSILTGLIGDNRLPQADGNTLDFTTEVHKHRNSTNNS